MRRNSTYFLFCTLLIQSTCKVFYDQELHKYLFNDYNPNSVPSNGATTVEMRIVLVGFTSVDTISSSATMQCNFRQWWIDERLRWDPADFGNITETRLQTDREIDQRIWIPDTTLYQNLNPSLQDKLSKNAAEVSYDGTVYLNNVGSIDIFFQFDLTDYPYDVSEIRLYFESWVYTADRVILLPRIDKDGEAIYKDFKFYQENIEWQVDNLTVSNYSSDYENGKFYTVVLGFDMKRQGSTITFSVVVPGLAISLLGLFYVQIPFGEGQRVPFLCSIVLSEVMFLVMLTQFVPVSKSSPRMVMLFLALSLVLTIITAYTIIFEAVGKQIIQTAEEHIRIVDEYIPDEKDGKSLESIEEGISHTRKFIDKLEQSPGFINIDDIQISRESLNLKQKQKSNLKIALQQKLQIKKRCIQQIDIIVWIILTGATIIVLIVYLAA